jgi:hypothetical protein
VGNVASKAGEVGNVASKTAEVANVAGKTSRVAEVASTAGKVWNGAKTWGREAWNGTKALGNDALAGARAWGGEAWNGTKALGDRALGGAKNLGSQAWNGSKNLGERAWVGAKNLKNGALNAADNLGYEAQNWLSHKFPGAFGEPEFAGIGGGLERPTPRPMQSVPERQRPMAMQNHNPAGQGPDTPTPQGQGSQEKQPITPASQPKEPTPHSAESPQATGEKHTSGSTREHVHQGGTEMNPQSPYKGKWDGSGVHDWDGLVERCKKDGFTIKEVTQDPVTGVRRTVIERTGIDPRTGAEVRGTIKKTMYPKDMKGSAIDAAGDQALTNALKGEPGTKFEPFGTKTRSDGVTPADGYFEATVPDSRGGALRVQGWFKENLDGTKTPIQI